MAAQVYEVCGRLLISPHVLQISMKWFLYLQCKSQWSSVDLTVLPFVTFSRMQAILSLPGNNACCDCGSPDPRWASINLGITLCIECSGIHRSFGVHLSKVRWEMVLLNTAYIPLTKKYEWNLLIIHRKQSHFNQNTWLNLKNCIDHKVSHLQFIYWT